jgi:hypothetical protein
MSGNARLAVPDSAADEIASQLSACQYGVRELGMGNATPTLPAAMQRAIAAYQRGKIG